MLMLLLMVFSNQSKKKKKKGDLDNQMERNRFSFKFVSKLNRCENVIVVKGSSNVK